MKKTVKNAKNKTPQKKKRANRKKKGRKSSDAIKTFLLVGLLIVLSVCISLIIIFIFNDSQKNAPAPQITGIESDPNTGSQTENNGFSGGISEISEQTHAVPDTRRSTQTLPITGTGNPAVSTAAPPETVSSSQGTSQRPVIKSFENLGNLAFVIDDAGNNLRELEPFLNLTGPLTIAVLPGLPYSAEAARRIRAAGKEVILHQPMEAVGAQNPGPGAIYSGMSEDEIRAVLLQNIAEVGPVAGMNNHQGSKITMDSEMMRIILAFCAEHNLYFLDSRTTAETAAPAAAAQIGMKIGQRDVFLDNEQDRDAMLRYLSDGLSKAQKNGSAVMIGHVWSPELAPLLAQQFSILTSQGWILTAASAIIKNSYESPWH